MYKPGDTVWIRCQAQAHERFASNEEAERVRCTSNQARYEGSAAWVSQNLPHLPADAQRMPEGQGQVFTCLGCNKRFHVLVGAQF